MTEGYYLNENMAKHGYTLEDIETQNSKYTYNIYKDDQYYIYLEYWQHKGKNDVLMSVWRRGSKLEYYLHYDNFDFGINENEWVDYGGDIRRRYETESWLSKHRIQEMEKDTFGVVDEGIAPAKVENAPLTKTIQLRPRDLQNLMDNIWKKKRK